MEEEKFGNLKMGVIKCANPGQRVFFQISQPPVNYRRQLLHYEDKLNRLLLFSFPIKFRICELVEKKNKLQSLLRVHPEE